MSVKVSTIVPVYNPGTNIDDCVSTLLNQSLPPDEYEVIFVDDGSTDETPARLDALAAEHPNVHVRHIPNSGWPGRPRNIGIDMAQGEFVYFIDNDDWIAHEALERMYARAVEDEADVVVGKVVGHGPGKLVPNGVFRRNRKDVTFEWAPLMWLLSPHKLFRRDLLNEHGIRFPEGRRRLEDHMFVVHAYFHAQSISILADYTCYHWMYRRSRTNESVKPFDPAGYYADVREILDLVDEHTEPGDLRERLYVHYYRSKVLGRLNPSANFLGKDEEYQRARFDEARTIAVERFDEKIDARLPLELRVRSKLLRENDMNGLLALLERESQLRIDASVVEVQEEGHEIVLSMEIGLGGADDLLRFESENGHVRWAPPADVDVLSDDLRDVTRDLPRVEPYVVLQSATDASEYFVPTDHELELREKPRAHGRMTPVAVASGRVSADTAAAGAPLPPGDWRVRANPNFVGFKARGPVGDTWRQTVVLHVSPEGDITVRRPTVRGFVARRLPGLRRRVLKIRRRIRRLRRRVMSIGRTEETP